jgi:outer membrane protein assembly factor BamA
MFPDAKLAQTNQISLCFQEHKEKSSLINEAENKKFTVRRIEVSGNKLVRITSFVRQMSFKEGDIFQGKFLTKSIN